MNSGARPFELVILFANVQLLAVIERDAIRMATEAKDSGQRRA